MRGLFALLLAAPALAVDENVNAQVVAALGERGVKVLHDLKDSAVSKLMEKHPEVAARAKEAQLELVKQLDTIPRAQKLLRDACGVDDLTSDANVKGVASRLVSDTELYGAVSKALNDKQRGEMEQNVIAGYKVLSQVTLLHEPDWASKQEAAAKAALHESGIDDSQFSQLMSIELEVTKTRLAKATSALAKASKAASKSSSKKASQKEAELIAPQFPFGPYPYYGYYGFPWAYPYVFMPPWNITAFPAPTAVTPAGYFLPYPFAPCWPFFPCVAPDEDKPSADA